MHNGGINANLFHRVYAVARRHIEGLGRLADADDLFALTPDGTSTAVHARVPRAPAERDASDQSEHEVDQLDTREAVFDGMATVGYATSTVDPRRVPR